MVLSRLGTRTRWWSGGLCNVFAASSIVCVCEDTHSRSLARGVCFDFRQDSVLMFLNCPAPRAAAKRKINKVYGVWGGSGALQPFVLLQPPAIVSRTTPVI